MPVLVVALTAASFAVVRPPVGDLWAVRARESAAANGVGLHYWFSWFGGIVPGSYSVLLPYLSRFADLSILAAIATVAVTAAVHLLLRGSRYPMAGTWAGAVGSGISLWSGRVPFALGMAVMIAALLCVRADRRWLAVVAAALATLISPVSGAFLALGLIGIVVHDRDRRRTAVLTCIAVTACLVAVAVYFSSPGPEGFPPGQAILAALACAVMLLAKAPSYVRTVLIVSLVACPVVALVPNGLGTNFERFTWLCLPVAVIATGRARPWIVVTVSAAALSMSLVGSVKDFWVASRPMSELSYGSGLVAALDRQPGLAAHRVEIVPDGTHVASYYLLGHASLARGFETQSDNAYNGILSSASLDADRYRTWLNLNAVGWIALDQQTLRHGPEDSLVRSGSLPYAHLVWSDRHWRLYRVASPRPIIEAPARVLDSDQSNLVLAAPRAGRLELRLRWSQFLQVTGPGAALEPDGHGWTVMAVRRPGRYVLHG